MIPRSFALTSVGNESDARRLADALTEEGPTYMGFTYAVAPYHGEFTILALTSSEDTTEGEATDMLLFVLATKLLDLLRQNSGDDQ